MPVEVLWRVRYCARWGCGPEGALLPATTIRRDGGRRLANGQASAAPPLSEARRAHIRWAAVGACPLWCPVARRPRGRIFLPALPNRYSKGGG